MLLVNKIVYVVMTFILLYFHGQTIITGNITVSVPSIITVSVPSI